MKNTGTMAALALTAVGGTAAMAAQEVPATDSQEAARHVAQATALAGADQKAPLFLCRADSTSVVKENLESGTKEWLEPAALADNLYYVGNRFVGVMVLRTSKGLILFDSSSSEDDAKQHLVPDLRKLGLDPRSISYVLVTHGHWDHYGGAKFLQETYGARIALSGPDWDLIEKLPANSLESANHPIPRRDVVVTDGQRISLGDTTVALYVTPGHTPGTLSAIVPVRFNGKTRRLSLFGSVAFPPTIAPTERTGGLRKYDESVLRFAQVSLVAHAEGILNTHVFADGTYDRILRLRSRSADAPNPFLTGSDFTHRYYQILHECLQAALLRPEGTNDWSKPLIPASTRAIEP
jgi:metallo-beta-lactamase class B